MKRNVKIILIAIGVALLLLVSLLLIFSLKKAQYNKNEVNEEANDAGISNNSSDYIKDKMLSYASNNEIACESESDIIPYMNANYKSYEEVVSYVDDVTGIKNYMFQAIGLDDIRYDVYLKVLDDGVRIEVTSYEE